MAIVDPALTPESIRAAMAIPSTDRMRGLKDGVGFATTPEQMAAVVAASSRGPEPTSLGPTPDGPWVGAICPHDDYLYAGRLYRRALERIEAKTVIVIGVFHAYRRFAQPFARLDSYESWWTPDGPMRVSPLRNWLERADFSSRRPAENAAHDLEHSIEPIAAWLRHGRPDREILPILAPSLAHDFMELDAAILVRHLDAWVREMSFEWGRDVAIVVSADAIHYGADFGELRYGPGNVEAHERACEEDRRILTEVLDDEGKVMRTSYRLMEVLLDDPWRPDAYRWTWCGRYSIPFGISLLENIAHVRQTRLKTWPLAYETSISAPPLDVHMPPLGFTAPASYEHFVGYPAVAFTFASSTDA